MTTPAITVGPHVTVSAAARLMNTHRIRRLPVVDDKGRLVGIVSRRDLLSVFLRPDEDIKADVRQVLDEILAAEPGEADVTVRNGIVTLTGSLDPKVGPHGDLIPVAIRLMWGVDGVVDIVDQLGEPWLRVRRHRDRGFRSVADSSERTRDGTLTNKNLEHKDHRRGLEGQTSSI